MVVLENATSQEEQAADLVVAGLGVRPVRMVAQTLTHSGNTIYRIDLPDDKSAVLRISVKPRAFAYTQRNLQVLSWLGFPVQSVLAAGPAPTGGSFIILSWLPGEDLVYQLASMTHPQMTALAERIVDIQRKVSLLPASKGFGWAPIGQNAPLATWTEIFGQPASDPSLFNDGTVIGFLRSRLATLRAQLEPYFSTVAPKPFLDELTTKNILIDNGELSGLIDFDFICYGDALLAIGATIACIAADVGPVGRFYGEELLRIWKPPGDGHRAVRFYAAMWSIGFLSAADGERAKVLQPIAEEMIGLAEAE